MGNFEETERRFPALRAGIIIGLCWGFIETSLLVWDGKPAIFSWTKYFIAAAIIIFLSTFLTTIITIAASRLTKLTKRAQSVWAISLLVPITVIVIPMVVLKVVSPSPRWEPGFIFGLWYIPIIFILWCLLLFFPLRYISERFMRLKTGHIKFFIIAILAIQAAVFPAIAGLRGGGAKSVRGQMPDIIFITLDTVRADHMASYGYFRRTTPFLDALALESIVFDNAAVQIPYTTGSHISMLTSRYPSEIGISKVGAQFDPRLTTLTKLLKDKGYFTAAFISSIVLNRKFTRALDFDVYDDTFSFRLWLLKTNVFAMFEASGLTRFFRDDEDLQADLDRRADAVTGSVLDWFSGGLDDRPIFLWVHYFDPHRPFDPPAPYDTKFQTTPALVEYLENRMDLEVWENKLKTKKEIIFAENNNYDCELAFMDNSIRDLIDGYKKKRGGLENAYIFVISDHGTSLGDHYYFGKVARLFDTIVKVPFFIRMPDGSGRRIDDQVEAIDIMPTILDLLDIRTKTKMSGRSLIPLISGERITARPAYSESLATPVKYSLRTPEWKIIYQTNKKKSFLLYNLEDDPFEMNDLSDGSEINEIPAIKILQKSLGEWIRDYHRGVEVKTAPMTREDIERLRALGYIE